MLQPPKSDLPVVEKKTKTGKLKKQNPTRGRIKGSKLGEAALHAFSSIIRAYVKSKTTPIPKIIKFSITECTKDSLNKNKLYKYYGKRVKAPSMKVVPISFGKAMTEEIDASFTDHNGVKKYLQYITKDEYDKLYAEDKYSVSYHEVIKERKYFKEVSLSEYTKSDKKSDFKVVEVQSADGKVEKLYYMPSTKEEYKQRVKKDLYDKDKVLLKKKDVFVFDKVFKYVKVVDDTLPEEERAKNLTVHLFEHKVKRIPGIGIADREKEKKLKEKKKKLLAEKRKKDKKLGLTKKDKLREESELKDLVDKVKQLVETDKKTELLEKLNELEKKVLKPKRTRKQKEVDDNEKEEEKEEEKKEDKEVEKHEETPVLEEDDEEEDEKELEKKFEELEKKEKMKQTTEKKTKPKNLSTNKKTTTKKTSSKKVLVKKN